MGMEPTPPFTLEGWKELLEEMDRGPADTPERRATLERMRFAEELFRRMAEKEKPAKAG